MTARSCRSALFLGQPLQADCGSSSRTALRRLSIWQIVQGADIAAVADLVDEVLWNEWLRSLREALSIKAIVAVDSAALLQPSITTRIRQGDIDAVNVQPDGWCARLPARCPGHALLQRPDSRSVGALA